MQTTDIFFLKKLIPSNLEEIIYNFKSKMFVHGPPSFSPPQCQILAANAPDCLTSERQAILGLGMRVPKPRMFTYAND